MLGYKELNDDSEEDFMDYNLDQELEKLLEEEEKEDTIFIGVELGQGAIDFLNSGYIEE